MSDVQYFEVEGAVFRLQAGQDMEVFLNSSGKWAPYQGDAGRVLRMSNPMSLEEVRPYMDRDPVDDAGAKEGADQGAV